MKKTTIILSILAIVAGGCGNKQSKGTVTSVSSPQYGGIYAFGDILNPEAPKGNVYIYPENDSTLLFYLYTNNGAPVYNSGAIDGRISIRDGEATFRKRFDFAETDCVLHFGFRGDTLTVAEGNKCECGFGHGVYIDDTFLRVTSEIPLYYTTISNDKVYFSQWKEEEESEGYTYPKINSRFTDYFPNLTLGQEHKRGKLIPSEIVDEFLTDLLNYPAEVEKKFYAVGKITGYKGMNLFIYESESEWTNEDSSDRHVDIVRYVLLYQQDGLPVLTFNSEYEDRGGDCRVEYTIGEGNESGFQSYFDTDTTLVSSYHSSVSEELTGFDTPLVYDKVFRWTIAPSGEKEILEITKLEFSSPFYDRSYLNEQVWSEVEDEGFNSTYPTKDEKWQLAIEECQTNVVFHIERIDGDLFPIFETTDDEGKIIDRYIVGRPHDSVTADSNYSAPAERKCPVIIKTSDGDLELLPEQRLLRLREE